MEGDYMASDRVIAELVGMGFEFSNVTEAVKAVGPSMDSALEYILNDTRKKSDGASSSTCLAGSTKSLRRRSLSSSQSLGKLRQPSIMEHLQSGCRPKWRKITTESAASVPMSTTLEVSTESFPFVNVNSNPASTAETSSLYTDYKDVEDLGSDWEQKSQAILNKHFGYLSLKTFQKEALSAWFMYKDCLVLAATGSGMLSCLQQIYCVLLHTFLYASADILLFHSL